MSFLKLSRALTLDKKRKGPCLSQKSQLLWRSVLLNFLVNHWFLGYSPKRSPFSAWEPTHMPQTDIRCSGAPYLHSLSYLLRNSKASTPFWKLVSKNHCILVSWLCDRTSILWWNGPPIAIVASGGHTDLCTNSFNCDTESCSAKLSHSSPLVPLPSAKCPANHLHPFTCILDDRHQLWTISLHLL